MDNCLSCGLAKNKKIIGGKIFFPHWIANTYLGDEGMSGHLVLYTKIHRDDFSNLKLEELEDLGPNIGILQRLLRQYWEKTFPGDEIERIYICYFHEGIFGNKEEEYLNNTHTHIHLIPRPKSIGKLLREYSKDNSIHAHSIYKIKENKNFPDRYLKTNERVIKMMNFLKNSNYEIRER